MANRISENLIFFRLPSQKRILSSEGYPFTPLSRIPKTDFRIFAYQIKLFLCDPVEKVKKKIALQNLLSLKDHLSIPLIHMLWYPFCLLG